MVLKLAARLAAFACILTFAVAETQDDETQPYNAIKNEVFLKTDFTPKAYTLTIRPYLLDSDGSRRFTFDGEVFINVTRTTVAKTLELYSQDINYTLSEYWLAKAPEDKIPLPNRISDPITNKISFELAQAKGRIGDIYVLHFKYVGQMMDDMHGFYRSTYTDSNNVTKWLGSTQFEPKYARRAFPSFDEPKLKATFQVTIIRHKSMTAYSNTRLQRSEIRGDYYIDTFQRTPVMSSYLLAFLVAEFNIRTDGNFGIIARPELYADTEYSASIGVKLLKAYDKYFDIPYYKMGIDKLDLAAIPDFDAGAMENWGLTTYREQRLLYNSKLSTLKDKQLITTYIAHELSHMWFGDLVTCEWWTYTWLHEGFARYFEYFMSHQVNKNFMLDQQFVVDELQSVMAMDASNKTNSVTNLKLNFLNNSEDIFNGISYNKGAAFIRMIRYTLGEHDFQKSLQEYLETYKYRNTNPGNLFNIWEKYWPASKRDEALKVFKSFTEQVGFPVITINVAKDGKSMTLSQRRFLMSTNDGSDDKLLYTVPVTYTTDKERDFKSTLPKLYLGASTKPKTIFFDSPIDWVIANIQEVGYYRVNYNTENWHKIHAALSSPNWGGVHLMNRAQIVDDLFNLARAGLIDYAIALPILDYLKTEVNYVPWKSAFRGYMYLANRLGKDMDSFSAYIRQQLEHMYNELGFDEKPTDTTLDIYNRKQILDWSCRHGNTHCIEEAKKRFHTVESTPGSANIRSVVYCTTIREGTEVEFNILFEKYKAEAVITEQGLIRDSLSCVQTKELVQRFYEIILSDHVRRQDKKLAFLTLIIRSSQNIDDIFDKIIRDFEKIAKVMNGYAELADVIEELAKFFTEERQLKKLQAFIAANKSKFGSAASSLLQTEKKVVVNLQWSSKYLNVVKQYFERVSNGGFDSVNSFKVLTMALLPIVSDILQ